MIKSKFNLWGIIAIIISILMLCFICFFVFALISITFLDGDIIPRGKNSNSEIMCVICVLIFLILLIITAWMKYFFFIRIDTDAKIISFKNIFTRKVNSYNFTELDGLLETYAKTRNGNFKILYLVKNKRAEKIINGYYYSNIDELKNALTRLNYLGFNGNFKRLSIKALFNKSMTD